MTNDGTPKRPNFNPSMMAKKKAPVLSPPIPPRARPGAAPQNRQPDTAAQSSGHQFFVNPYNFVPLHSSRDSQDGPPPSQGIWHDGRFSGHLTIHLTTETPLLTVRRARIATEKAPALLTVRTAPDGTPAINGSSIKGMLRSLFEQATGSRLGVFGHSKRLSFRRAAEDARWLKLAKVVKSDDSLELSIFEGLRARRGDVPAPVWVEHGHVSRVPFGTEVFMLLTLHQKDQRKAWFPSSLAGAPSRARAPQTPLSAPDGWWDVGATELLVRAKLHNTGHTIGGKRFERVFVEEIIESDGVALASDGLVATTPRYSAGDRWKSLQNDWRAQIDSMLGNPGTDANGKQLALAPYGSDEATRAQWKKLRPGQTLFAHISGENILGMYPGMITRQMDNHAPIDLVPDNFRPASSDRTMSPADRVFGWVASEEAKGKPAYRGQLAVGGVHCLTTDPIEHFPAVRLATLGEPKPSQFRFYTRGRTQNATQKPVLLQGQDRRDGFDPKRHGIAGHKVYPHHGVADPKAWWRTPTQPWEPSDDVDDTNHPTAPNGQPLSYLAPNGTKKKVSSELDSWVKPGVTFETRMRLTNLTADDLGALLWILDTEGGHHRLGLGKPLGFGSLAVRVVWEKSSIRNRDQLIDRYKGISAGDAMSQGQLVDLRTGFDKHFCRTQPVVYRAMLQSIQGFSGQIPVHYPWTHPARPQAESFHWFVTNERGDGSRDTTGPRHALPPLGTGGDPRLPVLKRRNQ